MIGMVLITCCYGVNKSNAAVDVSSSELETALDLVMPTGSSLTWDNEIYEAFHLDQSGVISGGIEVSYETRLTDDPNKGDSLPHVRVMIYSYLDQDSAHSSFESYGDVLFASTQREILSEDERSIFYKSEEAAGDVFGSMNTEQESFHLLHVNGNLLYQASFYQEDANFALQSNLKLFDDLIEDVNAIETLVSDLTENIKWGLSLLFPPSFSELSTTSEKSSLHLQSLYETPENGSMDFQLYVGDLSGAMGTVLDSSGINTPVDGDLYLYLNNEGMLQAGIYAPDYDSDCEAQSGWFRLQQEEPLHPYEWNDVRLQFGVDGFALSVNDTELSCYLWAPHSGRSLYFGDYPYDSINESFIGTLDSMEIAFSQTSDGRIWDEILAIQDFYDVSVTDEDFAAFSYLKEAGVFMGSQGFVLPETQLNRAEMVKVILKTFDISSEGAESVSFPDVSESDWFEPYVSAAAAIGMVEGQEDGQFLPASGINRAEFFTMLHRLSGLELEYEEGLFDDVDGEDWFGPAAAFSAEYKLVMDDEFEAGKVVSRREAAEVLFSLITAGIV